MTEILQHRVGELLALAIRRACECRRPVLVAVSRLITPPEDLLSLVQCARRFDEESFLWERPQEQFAIAGVGAAVTMTAEGEDRFREIAAACDAVMRDAVTDAPTEMPVAAPLFVGGFAFAPDSVGNGLWQGFPAARLLVPRVLIAQHNRHATLTVSVMIDQQSESACIQRRVEADLQQLGRGMRGGGSDCIDSGGTRYEATPMPPTPLWMQAVADTVGDIAAGRLSKLVLARACTVTSDRAFDCGRILRRLRQTYPSCALFWIGTPHASFLGATPESLVRLRGRTVHTAALAGSAAPGTSIASALSLGRALKHSEKDRCEHAVVVRAITTTLAPLCEKLEVAPAPQLLRLDNVQHLLTPISGRLVQRHSILDLIERLHPSPAVAGYPRAAALQLLPQREALNRGWYAGAVGWMDRCQQGEFSVAIRSALVRGSRATAYAGAGIVTGSDPLAELAETRLKLQPLLSALLEV